MLRMTTEFQLSPGTPRTAVVTGGARRIGAVISRALAEDGWTLLIHCRDSTEEAEALAAVAPGSRVLVADLAARDIGARFSEMLEGMPPAGLLVNNASGFAHDTIDDFDIGDWDRHIDVNLRAPALITQAFARAVPQNMGALVINLLDAKLAAPNPDFFTYTISKMGLAGLTELTARALAGRGMRVCGIAPSVTLVSGPQTRENFAAVHARNALRRGVTVEQIVAALRFIIATPTLTGQTIMLDAGQRFLSLERDVQFLPHDAASPDHPEIR
jgi:NAD(P)-dependent dehydrogenase (short-subunit alcohol dehydrogenase family)